MDLACLFVRAVKLVKLGVFVRVRVGGHSYVSGHGVFGGVAVASLTWNFVATGLCCAMPFFFFC